MDHNCCSSSDACRKMFSVIILPVIVFLMFCVPSLAFAYSPGGTSSVAETVNLQLECTFEYVGIDKRSVVAGFKDGIFIAKKIIRSEQVLDTTGDIEVNKYLDVDKCWNFLEVGKPDGAKYNCFVKSGKLNHLLPPDIAENQVTFQLRFGQLLPRWCSRNITVPPVVKITIQCTGRKMTNQCVSAMIKAKHLSDIHFSQKFLKSSKTNTTIKLMIISLDNAMPFNYSVSGQVKMFKSKTRSFTAGHIDVYCKDTNNSWTSEDGSMEKGKRRGKRRARIRVKSRSRSWSKSSGGYDSVDVPEELTELELFGIILGAFLLFYILLQVLVCLVKKYCFKEDNSQAPNLRGTLTGVSSPPTNLHGRPTPVQITELSTLNTDLSTRPTPAQIEATQLSSSNTDLTRRPTPAPIEAMQRLTEIILREVQLSRIRRAMQASNPDIDARDVREGPGILNREAV